MSSIFQRLLETGLPTRDVQVALGDNIDNSETQIATQTTHDNLNVNANVQLADADVSEANPLPVSLQGPVFSTYTFPAPFTWNNTDYTDAFDMDGRSHFTVTFETSSGTVGDKIQIEGSPDNSTVTWTSIANVALEEITHTATFAVHYTLENVGVRYLRLRNNTGGMLSPSFGACTGTIGIAIR
jgi:hypothetical protein